MSYSGLYRDEVSSNKGFNELRYLKNTKRNAVYLWFFRVSKRRACFKFFNLINKKSQIKSATS